MNIGAPDRKSRKVKVKQHMCMDHPVAVLHFSPDASGLVAVDRVGNISTYNVTQHQTTSLHTSTDRALSHKAPRPEQFLVTRGNLLLRVVHEGLSTYWLSVLDLLTRQEKQRLTSDKLHYNLSIIELHEREEFVMVCTSESVS